MAAVVAITLALPAAARADGITASCTANGVTGACSSGWYTSDVTVRFTLPGGSSNPQGCGDQTISTDTAGVTITCTVAVTGSQCCRLDVTIKRDATPPTVTSLTPQRGPDANGYYNCSTDHGGRHRFGVRDRLMHIGRLLRSRLELRFRLGDVRERRGPRVCSEDVPVRV